MVFKAHNNSSDVLFLLQRLNLTNSSFGSDGAEYFSMYYSEARLALECTFAMLAASCNFAALALSRRHRYHHHAYRALFWNMSITNAILALSSCLCNNFLYLQDIWPALKLRGFCHTLALLAGINMSTMVLGLVSCMSLLGFGLVHYLLLCQPLHSDQLLLPNKVRLTLLACWICNIILGGVLSYFCFSNATTEHCNLLDVAKYNVLGSNIYLALLAICYLTVVGFSVRLYVEIRGLRSNLGRQEVFDDDLQFERQALRTLVLLLAVDVVCLAPFFIVYAISINTNDELLGGQSMVLYFLYYMNMLPYLKYASDPLIYGKRMLGLQKELSRVANLAKCKCKKTKSNGSKTNTTRVYRFTKPLVKT